MGFNSGVKGLILHPSKPVRERTAAGTNYFTRVLCHL